MLRGGLDLKRSQLPLQRKLSYLIRSSSRRLLRKSQAVQSQYLASQLDSTWFSSLPQKIQQRQFTREEQVFLAGNREVVILDASDQALYRLGRQPNTSTGALRTDTTFQTGQKHNKSDLSDTGAEPSIDSAVDMDESFYDSFRWLDEEDDLDLALDDYHHAVTETTLTSFGSRQSPSFRRTLSLTSLKPRQNSFSLDRPQSSHLNAAPVVSGLGTRPLISLLAPRHHRSASVSSIEPSAKHYQDPEARLKLRVYLASPQKFDEAIEFGFPSLESTAFAHPILPAASSRRIEETERSFLDDDASSPHEDEEDRYGDGSSTNTDSPRTPQDAIFQSRRPSKQSSLDRSGIARPHILRHSLDPYAQSAPGGREMTLHMTLTRPDLRTDTEINLEPAKTDDPLKLSELPISDDKHPIWDSALEDRSKMRKLWKRLTSR